MLVLSFFLWFIFSLDATYFVYYLERAYHDFQWLYGGHLIRLPPYKDYYDNLPNILNYETDTDESTRLDPDVLWRIKILKYVYRPVARPSRILDLNSIPANFKVIVETVVPP